MKRVFIKTYGCQMNERDSEAVAAMLRGRGYDIVRSEGDADVILLNTCSVRDFAEQKAIGKMTTLAHLKQRKPELVLGYMGCMAQSRGASLAEKQPAVDLVVGTQRFHHVPDYLDAIFSGDPEGAISNRDRLACGSNGESGSRMQFAPTKHHAIVDVAEESGSQSTIKDHVLGTNDDRQVTGFVSIM